MNHEFWNEIGNLYFLCGAYEPAIHAYLRSIKLDSTFGRSYSNLAMAYVQTGKYQDAINLYRRSIELLSDEQEKAATWNKLGILYRQIKEYDSALEAYQRADLIMPQAEMEVRTDAKKPLAVLMPEIDLASILAKGSHAKWKSPGVLAAEINAEFEMAEAHHELFEDGMFPFEFENYSSPEDVAFKPPIAIQGEWKLAYVEATPLAKVAAPVEPVEMEITPLDSNALEAVAPSDNVQVGDAASDSQPMEEQHVIVEAGSAPELSSTEEETAPMQSAEFFENTSHAEPVEVLANETDTESPEYLQTEYVLNDISPEEQKRLELEIIKYQQATAVSPRSYILWMELGEAYKAMGQYKEAISAFQKAIVLNPANFMCHYHLGLVFATERRTQEAVRSFQRVLELNPNFAQAHASLASQYRMLGSEEAAQVHIEKARAMQFEGESDYNRACLEAICGNKDSALDLLEVALQSKQTYITWVQKDPDFHTLRGDRRFKEILLNYAAAIP